MPPTPLLTHSPLLSQQPWTLFLPKNQKKRRRQLHLRLRRRPPPPPCRRRHFSSWKCGAIMYVDVQRTSLRRVLPATFSPTTGQRPICSLTPRRPLRPGHPCAVYFFVLLLLSGSLSPAVSQTSSATTPSSFYPFRQDAGDNATANLDDGGSGKISLLQSFPFFAKRHNKLYVSTRL